MTMTNASASGVSTFAVVDAEIALTLDELTHACGLSESLVVELVDLGFLEPQGAASAQWRFSGICLQRSRFAWRLMRDLGVNAAGAALAFELMQEIERLERGLD